MSDSLVLADSNLLIQRCFNTLPTGMAVEQLCCFYRGMNEAQRERLFVALVGMCAVARATSTAAQEVAHG